MHKQLDERIQAIIEEHREARKHQSIGDRRQDFVDVLLDLPGENGEQHLDDITIKALILVRNSIPIEALISLLIEFGNAE